MIWVAKGCGGTFLQPGVLGREQMTIADLIIEARHLVNSLGEAWLADATGTGFTALMALQRAYIRYAMETKCFRVPRALQTVIGQGIYSFAAFGSEAADTDSLSVLAAADNVDDFLLIAGQPVNTYVDGHYISVTIKNPNLEAVAELAWTYTIVGTLAGGLACTEVLTATAQTLDPGKSQTMTSTRRFATVSSITPSGAQTAGLEHSAGVGAQAAGARLFEVVAVTYDRDGTDPSVFDAPLTEARLPVNWRTLDNSTPTGFLRWGDRAIRVLAPPDAGCVAEIDGYETPDLTSFAAETDEPDMVIDDQELLAVYAAILLMIRDPSEENAIRGNVLYPRWQSGIVKAKGRMHSGGSFMIGRNAGLSQRSPFVLDSEITMVS